MRVFFTYITCYLLPEKVTVFSYLVFVFYNLPNNDLSKNINKMGAAQNIILERTWILTDKSLISFW